MLQGDIPMLGNGPRNWRELPKIRADDPLVFHDGTTRINPGTETRCLICTKRYWHGPYVGVLDPVCPGCAHTYADTAALACVRCRHIVLRVAPGRLDNGFIVRPRTRLHVSGCPSCVPDHTVSTIVESAAWEKSQRMPTVILTGYGRSDRVLQARPVTRLKKISD